MPISAAPMTAAFPLETLAAMPAANGCACGHEPGTCPEAYRRDLEPADSTIAELQSVVVAMRHRGDDDEQSQLDVEDSLALYVGQLRHVAAEVRDEQARRVQCIRLAIAIAATAVRYRERIE